MINFKSILLLVLTLANLFQGGTVFNAAQTHEDYSKEPPSISEIRELVRDYSIYEIDEDKAKDLFAKAVIEALPDKYAKIGLVSESDYLDYANANYSGFGFDMAVHKGEYVVSNILSNGPAKEAGFKVGDAILKLNGIEIHANEKLFDGAQELRASDEMHDFELKRGGKHLNLSLNKKSYVEPSIEHRTIDKDIYYIDINNFSFGMSEEFLEQVEKIDKFKFDKLIIDLRNNPGGSLQDSVNCAAALSLNPVKAYLEEKMGIIELEKNQENGIKIDGSSLNIVLLVNSETASAAELLAELARVHSGAKIVGSPSYGKWIGQEPFLLGRYSVVLSVCKFSAINEFSVKKEPLQPDYMVEELYENPDEDEVLDKAIQLLRE